MSLLSIFRKMGLNDWLAVWGAFLSTVLAAIKIAEWWRDRNRLEIGFTCTTSESEGNTIIIRNLYSKPIIITYWEIFLAKNPRRDSEQVSLESADFDNGDQVVAAHDFVQWNFSEAGFFGTSEKFLKGRGIYLRLCIAGRKPIVRRLYPFS